MSGVTVLLPNGVSSALLPKQTTEAASVSPALAAAVVLESSIEA